MKIEKRSGGYRVQPMRDGKRYSLTFDHKPTKSDIEQALFDAIARENQSNGIGVTFKKACELYNDSKKNVLSATTYREYTNTPKRLPDWFLNMNVSEITQDNINWCINELSVDRAPKTVRNYHGYISSVLSIYNPSLNISTTLPQKSQEKAYMPTESDVKNIIQASIGTEYEIPIKLSCYGLRRSEICAITSDDVDENGILYIHKTKVMDNNKKWIVQERTKTSASCRYVPIDKALANQIREHGCAYSGHPNNIYDFLDSTQKKLGIPHFRLHQMRHYTVSKLSSIGMKDADIMEVCGYETDYVMKKIYRESLQNEKEKRNKLNKITKNLF